MIGTIILVIVGVPIILVLGLFILGILGEGLWAIGEGISETVNDLKNYNEDEKILHDIFEKMGYPRVQIISDNISDEALKQGLDVYYNKLHYIMENDTITEPFPRNSDTNHFVFSFYKYTGLKEAIDTLGENMESVATGSGWVEYKKYFEQRLGKGCFKEGDKKDVITLQISKELQINFEDQEGYGGKRSQHVTIVEKGENVLVGHIYISQFKPGLWIKKVLSLANGYKKYISEMKSRQGREQIKSSYLPD